MTARRARGAAAVAILVGVAACPRDRPRHPSASDTEWPQVRWTAPGSAPHRLEDALVARDGNGLIELDRDGHVAGARSLVTAFAAPELSDGARLMAYGDGAWLVGNDATGLREQWRILCGGATVTCDLVGGRSGDRLILFGDVRGWTGVVAIDRTTGRELWRRPTAWSDRAEVRIAIDGDRVVVLGPDRVLALDRDGRALWERPRGGGMLLQETALAAAGGRVVFADAGIRIVDAATGDAVAHIEGHSAAELALDGDLLLLAETAGAGSEVTAFDAATGRARWRARPADRVIPPLLADRAHVYLRAARRDDSLGVREASMVIALARGDGAVLWRYPLGVNRGAVASDGAVIVDRHSVVPDAASIVALVGDGLAPPLVTIAGQVRATDGLPPLALGGLRVRIEDEIATTDADGRFAASVRALGVATVTLIDPPRAPAARAPLCLQAPPVRVAADTAIPPTVELRVVASLPCPPD